MWSLRALCIVRNVIVARTLCMIAWVWRCGIGSAPALLLGLRPLCIIGDIIVPCPFRVVTAIRGSALSVSSVIQGLRALCIVRNVIIPRALCMIISVQRSGVIRPSILRNLRGVIIKVCFSCCASRSLLAKFHSPYAYSTIFVVKKTKNSSQ